ncbi:unnamed protein product [Chrysoparadoxa australica]
MAQPDDLPNQPKDTAFRQQRLHAFQPILLTPWVIGAYLLAAIAFIPLGSWIFVQNGSLSEYKIQYGGDGADPAASGCAMTTSNEGISCSLTFDVTEHLAAPVYVHYELTNFYQNHRRYVKSFSAAQLSGSVVGSDDLDSCSPLVSSSTQLLNPCGLIANSMFNDVITVTAAPSPFTGTSSSYMLETGIAWPSDVDTRFNQPDGFMSIECPGTSACDDSSCLGSTAQGCGIHQDEAGVRHAYWYPDDDTTQYLYETFNQVPLGSTQPVISPLEGVESEHFIVWMRVAALPSFRKLYGKIESDIPAGSQITFQISNNFYADAFGGTKSLILSNAGAFGGSNGFLGIAFLVIGFACLMMSAGFTALAIARPRKLGDWSVLRSKQE